MSVRDVVQAAAGQGGDDKLYVEDVFSTYLYAGNNSTQNVSNGIDLAGEGGMAWIKVRNESYDGLIYDTERGPDYSLKPSSTSAQAYYGSSYLSSFNADGFSIGNEAAVNQSSKKYVSWVWRKAPKFFDVVTWTGGGAETPVAHNLDSVPGMVIIKRTDSTGDWYVGHRGSGSYYLSSQLILNSPAAGTTNAVFGASWSSTNFTPAGPADISGATYAAYLFAHNAGGFGDDGEQSIISCGSYTGNGSTANGPEVDLGWEPQWIMVKNTSQSNDPYSGWIMFDTMRGLASTKGSQSIYDPYLWAQNSNAEERTAEDISPTATGFKMTSGGATATNANGSNYIYIAIRRGPMKTPESGTEVFNVLYETGTGSARNVNAGFPIDTFFIKDVTAITGPTQGGSNDFYNRLAGNSRYLFGSFAETQTTGYDCLFDSIQNGVNVSSNWSSYVYIQYAFGRANSFFDTVCFIGDDQAGRTVAHNLGVTPELMFVKARSTTGEWWGYSSTLGATKYMILNNSDGAGTSSLIWNNTAPTSSVFSVGSYEQVNRASQTFIAYLFGSCPGVSKVGNYSGTGADLNVDCGFSAGARFVMIKRTDSTGGWYVWDSARGIVAGNDPYFLMNSYLAQVGNTDYIDPLASGFTVTSSAPAAINASGGSYIFLAIA